MAKSATGRRYSADIKARSHIRCAVLRSALLRVAVRSTTAHFSVMNIYMYKNMADDDDDDVLLLTSTYCALRLRQIRRKKRRVVVIVVGVVVLLQLELLQLLLLLQPLLLQ